MSNVWICAAALVLFGCGARETADGAAVTTEKASPPAVAAAAPAGQNGVTDEMIGAPIYPGATEMASTRLRMSTGTGVTLSVIYRTPDTPVQVAKFFQEEFSKLGTLEESINVGDQLKSVAVRRADGSLSSIQASSDGKGPTAVAVYRFFPAKR